MKILIVDDSKFSRTVVIDALEALGHEVIPAQSGEEAITLFQAEHPDLVILDVVMHGMSGLECISQLRALNATEWIPIIFLSGQTDEESLSKGIDAGGDDYLTKPLSKIILSAKIKAMQRIADMRHQLVSVTKKLEILSSTDSLTHLKNRFQFDKELKSILAHANRHHHEVSLFFIDVDHFKEINDTFGHPTGDLLLQEVSNRLNQCIRINDVLARLGGDEFAIILREVEDIDPEMVAKKLIQIFSEPFFIEDQILNVTASIGIATYPAQGATPENLMKSADIALYKSKKAGRNQYTIYAL